ncbi:MAG: protein kinase [Planctomycetota bacterium]|nr:protein kinase [Planctomycetota bacterium]MDA0918060.1 protein kinase [Planctomycetota bacterium]MDA1161167.1 protein kinase [Planctomycetota bacterium]
MLEDSTNRELLAEWRGGNERAATVLVRRYMARLTSLASSRLSRKLARRIDAEDVVLSAWRSFFVATGRKQVNVPDDDNLWPLLVTMTLRKLARQAAKHSADRRSISAESELPTELDWPAVVARDPTPFEAAMVTDEIENLMSDLSPSDREILTRRLQGEPHDAIAAGVDCSERTVRRSLQRIRERYVDSHRSEVSASGADIGTGSQNETSRSTSAFPSGNNQLAELPSPTTPPQFIGKSATVHFSDAVLHQLIGQGAFGKVYRATRRADGTTVAVKYLRKEFWRNVEAADQLVREVSIVSRLSHPGIIKHFGWGRGRQDATFAMMEWVDGENLDSWRRSSTPTVVDIVQCGLAICDALSTAHQAGIVHADLTPSNIIRRRDGSFVLTDFGFSRQLSNPSKTISAGTPGFLAPEQLSNVFGTVSHRTDVFGVGGVLYFLLTGTTPFTGRDVAEIFARTLSLQQAASIIDSVPDADSDNTLGALIAHCLTKEPSERPESIDKVAEKLRLIGSE